MPRRAPTPSEPDPCATPASALLRVYGPLPAGQVTHMLFRRFAARRLGPVGVALTLYDIWRRVPPQHRQRLMQGARTHGPRIASSAVRRGSEARRRRGGRTGP